MNVTLIFENESGISFPFDERETAKQVMEAALDYVNCPYETQVNLLITDGETIRQVNEEFRGIGRETDVLSFPTIEYRVEGQFDPSQEDAYDFDPESGELLLGDMMLCASRVLAQAEEYGHSVLREYCFLIAHSMLHLFGYDHVEANEAARMEAMQEEILGGMGITRD